MMWVLGAFGAVRRALSALWGMARANPALAAIVVLAGVSGWLWYTRGEARDQRDEAIAGRAADRTAYVQAQAEAHRLAVDAKAATEARYRANAERSDNAFKVQLADARDSTAEYIRTHRVRPQGVAGSGSNPAPAPGDSGSGGGERPSGETFMVAVKEGDIAVCTTNTLRLEAVRDWAATLAD